MKAVGYYKSLAVDDPQSLIDVELPIPTIGPHDLLVEVKAVSVNPIDYKTRLSSGPFSEDSPRILGFLMRLALSHNLAAMLQVLKLAMRFFMLAQSTVKVRMPNIKQLIIASLP